MAAAAGENTKRAGAVIGHLLPDDFSKFENSRRDPEPARRRR